MTTRRAPLSVTALVVASLFLLSPSLFADDIDTFVEASMKEQNVPGLALLVIQGGETVKLQGYGMANLEHEVPVTPDTIFQSGSVGKMFTAAGLLLLVEEGKLSLDDRLAKHFGRAPAAWHRMTVRHLLTHTSGIKDYGNEFDYRKDYTEDELLETVMKLPVQFEPGTQWSYSNSGYVAAGALLSKLADEHWSDFLEKRVFAPAGMKTAREISELDLVPHRADGYEPQQDGTLRNQEWVSPTWGRTADGALYFSARDLEAFGRTLRARGLLSEESYDQWWTPVQLEVGTYPYGFGWGVGEQRGRRVVEHGGSWQGFRTAIAYYTEDDLIVAALSNSSSGQPERILTHVAGMVNESLRLPSTSLEVDDPDAARTSRLRAVLDDYANWRTSDDMGPALASTASGSAREAFSRISLGRALEQATAFRYLAEDDVAARGLTARGAPVERIVYYALVSEERTRLFRFHLTPDGRVAHFERG